MMQIATVGVSNHTGGRIDLRRLVRSLVTGVPRLERRNKLQCTIVVTRWKYDKTFMIIPRNLLLNMHFIIAPHDWITAAQRV